MDARKETDNNNQQFGSRSVGEKMSKEGGIFVKLRFFSLLRKGDDLLLVQRSNTFSYTKKKYTWQAVFLSSDADADNRTNFSVVKRSLEKVLLRYT